MVWPVCLLAGSLLASRPAAAQLSGQTPAVFDGVGIDEQLGAYVPASLVFRNEQGEAVEIGSFFDETRPVLLTLVYHDCPMLCSVVLDKLTDALGAMTWTPGAEFDVLSTEIFFAIVGAQNDQGLAAVLALVLLSFTLSAFYVQRRWLGRRSYTTVTGKGDTGVHGRLPHRLHWIVYGTALPWAALTLVIYCMIMFGGFVETWGRDHSFTLRHYIEAFGITAGEHGLIWSGAAWNSFWTTITIAAVAAPLTAAAGLLTAWLLVRQRFVGKDTFEFCTMLSFAIPGTVIGVSYILAFNGPPIELTGTGAILVLGFIFRNMPVGVRAGIASLSQLDQSLDEASLTLGANSFVTVRRVILPLLRPAVIAALVFSFVRAITAISAVIFLVSADYDMATSYIIGRVENGDYGLAISYCSVLILVMLASITIVQLLVGERRLHRRRDAAPAGAPMIGSRAA